VVQSGKGGRRRDKKRRKGWEEEEEERRGPHVRALAFLYRSRQVFAWILLSPTHINTNSPPSVRAYYHINASDETNNEKKKEEEEGKKKKKK